MTNNNLLSYENKFETILIKVQLILCLLIALFTMLKNSPIVSLFFSLTFIVLIINFVSLLFRSKIEKSASKDLMLLFIISILAFVAVISVSYGLSFNYFKKYMMFCSTLIFMFIVSIVQVNQKLVKFILKTNFILFMAYYMFYTFGNAPYYGGGLTLNYTNPNLLSLWLAHTILYAAISILFFKPKFIKLAWTGVMAITLFMVLETRARTVYISLLFFAIMFVLIVLRKQFSFNRKTTIILILFPLIFAVTYMELVYNPRIIEVLDFMTSTGKGLDSRMIAWNYSFDIIKKNIIFGNYYMISDGTGMSQLFNIHIDVMGSYGCLVFVAFILYFYRIIYRISITCETKLQKIALASFFTVIIMGSGEAAFVSGSVGMYILSCSFLLIARYNNRLQDTYLRRG